MGQIFGKIDVEVPKHEVLPKPEGATGKYDLRKYPSQVAAETAYDTGKGDRDSFMRLAKYIGVFGKPENEQKDGEGGSKIAMTAPVVSQPVSMTSPVVTTETGQDTTTASGEQGKVMQFLLPSKFTMENAPEPANPLVKLREMPERVLAVHSYSGYVNEGNSESKKQALLAELENDKITVVGKPFLQRYNPPFTLGPFRRNEVAVEVRL
uniref:Heme-binding-like protein chloroplastic-like n=1 Tax=Tetraselmis sp. GSL018 TaxID=582737 RepID=A0A061R8Y8_9CHLO|mmetsp:Transcript_33383/g.79147  ORF Transcript_33383/g.79147 Transcript_33383/m.79147 type:complete len:209 (+) Transcript_33383:117-743(+)